MRSADKKGGWNDPNGKRVLVVDDEESVGIGISEMLKDAGFDARYATSGPEAVRRA